VFGSNCHSSGNNKCLDIFQCFLFCLIARSSPEGLQKITVLFMKSKATIAIVDFICMQACTIYLADDDAFSVVNHVLILATVLMFHIVAIKCMQLRFNCMLLSQQLSLVIKRQ